MEQIKAKKEKLTETANKLATKVYEEAAKANNTNEQASQEEAKNSDVQDAEFEEK